MKRKHGEKAQAFTELLAGLLGIMMVFVGLLLVAVFTRENVQGVISARGIADVAASDGGGTADARSILEWSWGNDELPFTPDDKPVLGVSSGQITNELTSRMPDKDLLLDYSALQDKKYFSNNVSFDEFLLCARLVGGTSKVNTESENEMKNLKNAAAAFYGVKLSSLLPQEKVYMPERSNYVDGDPE